MVALFMCWMLTLLPLFIVYAADMDGPENADNMWFSPLITGITVMGYCALGVVAAELEQPFGTDANDLPLRDLQIRFLDAIEKICSLDVPKTVDLNCAPPKRYDPDKAPPTKNKYGQAIEIKAKTGWASVSQLNKELKYLNLDKYAFAIWCTERELVEQWSLPLLSRKFRGLSVPEDLARHFKRRVLSLARPKVTQEEVEQVVDHNLAMATEVQEIEMQRAALLEELGPRRSQADTGEEEHSLALDDAPRRTLALPDPESVDPTSEQIKEKPWGGLRVARINEQRGSCSA
jgi:hypothetical protein